MHFMVTARMTPFKPGASPPPVSIPTRFTSAIVSPPFRMPQRGSVANPTFFSLAFGRLGRPSQAKREKRPDQVGKPPYDAGRFYFVECLLAGLRESGA